VPRRAQIPGGRLRLDPRDLYACGAHRGGINERWFASTTHANNGPDTPADEGLSYAAIGEERIALKDIVDTMGDELLGAEVMRQQGGWNVLCKFFDNYGAIPHHMHQMDKHASLVGQKGKTETYYFPPQYNLTVHNFPYTFMGLEPGTSKGDVVRCLENWDNGDNGILYLSRAYKLEVGSVWHVDAGILHAPGSLVTYETQVNSDVFSCFQSMLEGRVFPWDMVVRDVPPEHRHDLDFIVGMLDWEANIDPEFALHRRRHPQPVKDAAEMADAGYCEKQLAQSRGHYSSTELTVFPGRSVVIGDAAAYGLIVVQGVGTVAYNEVATPSLIRYGEMTSDELFVSAPAAQRGVTVTNRSDEENLVMLKHFGPEC
jgi:hypothetical protein